MKKMFLQTSTLMCALVLATSCKNATQQTEAVSYKTLEVDYADRTLNQNYSAVINGRQSVEIRPQVSGTITKVCIPEGAKVRQGQVLFVIDRVPYEAALQTAVANVKSAEAAVATARMTAESKEELRKEDVVSDFDLQTARNSLLEAEAALAQAKAEEVNARNNLSYTEVKSPVDGVAGMLPYRVGALVSSSITTPLTTVSDDSEVYAYFSMTENQVLTLISQSGTLEKAMQEMPEVELLLSNGMTYAHKGKIDAISGTIEAGTGVVSVRATFPNPEQLLRNGGSGQVIFPHQLDHVVVIPQEATYEIQDKIFAYKVIDGKASSVQLQVYPVSNGTEYVVEKGLEKGDVIIAEGAGLVQEGATVG
ncbi:MAG: efflux RND transporter periplasmic adaptor subunit [Bacteroides sp.]|nr:efflux RND transporter periplasmic adaptor subunit [Bacteroides sp.]